MNTFDEEKFMKRINERHSGAFRLLFMNFYPALVSFALHYLKEREQSEDIVQEVFVSAWTNKMDYASYAGLKTFLYTSVKNACINYLKHLEVENKYVSYVVKSADFKEESIDLSIMEEELYRLLYKAIKELPPRCREVIELKMEGKNNEEIAAILKISPLTVKTQKQIAMKLLKSKLGNLYDCILFLFMI